MLFKWSYLARSVKSQMERFFICFWELLEKKKNKCGFFFWLKIKQNKTKCRKISEHLVRNRSEQTLIFLHIHLCFLELFICNYIFKVFFRCFFVVVFIMFLYWICLLVFTRVRRDAAEWPCLDNTFLLCSPRRYHICQYLLMKGHVYCRNLICV